MWGYPTAFRASTVVLMTAKRGSPMVQAGNHMLVDGFARSVISKVNATPHQRRNRRIEIGSRILYSAALLPGRFDEARIIEELAALRITNIDIVDHCIPQVAAALGEGWIEDRLSFVQVSMGSARLFGLCKAIGETWDNLRPPMNARNLLLVTVYREDHIIGTAVLADQLRRRGHSVRVHSNGTAESIPLAVCADRYDGVLVSASTTQALETAVSAIKKVKISDPRTIVVLGGAAVAGNEGLLANTGADLITNEIDMALDAMTGDDIDLRVAE